jgi:dihydropteroate synthase
VNARVLSASGSVALADRLATYAPREATHGLRAAVDCAVLAIDGAPPVEAQAVADAVVARGGGAFVDEQRLVVAARWDVLSALEGELTGAARSIVVEVLRAFDADRTFAPALRLRSRTLDFSAGAAVMAILNVTPDSFHDGGKYQGLDRARARAAEMVAAGAGIIDIGGQSYAAGATRIDEAQERGRVVPVVEALVRDGLGVPLSIDTFKSGVAEAALAAGAELINDCSGLRDERLAGVVARYDAALVIMHLKGELGVREPGYRYDDALGEIADFLRVRLERARAAGVAPDALVVDPGLEFGKEPATDLEILEHFGELRSLGAPLLLAASRKRFIGSIFDRPAAGLLVPSLAAAAVGIAAGARLLRVHDVAETALLARMLAAVESGGREGRNRIAAPLV